MKGKKEWVLKVRCVVEKEVVLSACTETEARQSPWGFAISERELSIPDWDVLTLEENK